MCRIQQLQRSTATAFGNIPLLAVSASMRSHYFEAVVSYPSARSKTTSKTTVKTRRDMTYHRIILPLYEYCYFSCCRFV